MKTWDRQFKAVLYCDHAWQAFRSGFPKAALQSEAGLR